VIDGTVFVHPKPNPAGTYVEPAPGSGGENQRQGARTQ
jgi:hypothetical protein